MKKLINFWARLMIVILGVAVAMVSLVSCKKESPQFQAPLFDNLGNYWVRTTTESQDAAKFFVQGLLMSYGFNHNESVRSFKEAIRLDSTYAMAYWGIAYALGPNYNAAMDPGAKKEVEWAVKSAASLAKEVPLTGWEKVLIKSAEVKYLDAGDEPNLKEYADFMEEASRRFPQNADILTFSAEAKMNLHPWDLYESKGGVARPWTAEILTQLERSMKLEPDHPLANHLYVHAVEASSKPSDGYEAAEKLSKVVPGSGHLVHMPSHIYINTGDYHLGTIANEQSVIVDSTYVAETRAQGVYPQLYYPHNYHFLTACAALEGRGAKSIESAYALADIIDRNYLEKPGYETTQHFLTIPYNVLVKFAQWEKIMALKRPDEKYPYLQAIWHYSRGMAFANTEKMSLAKTELQSLELIRDSNELKELAIFDINTAQDVAEIAMRVLAAEIADKSDNKNEAIVFLKQAIEIESQLNYNEPPDWFFSVRHMLGDLYLRMDKYREAENVYRKDLMTFPKNGFALNGLYHSLVKQLKSDEALKVLGEFKEAWKYSDSKLGYSRIDVDGRKDLAIKIKSNSPSDLIYLIASFCGIR